MINKTLLHTPQIKEGYPLSKKRLNYALVCLLFALTPLLNATEVLQYTENFDNTSGTDAAFDTVSWKYIYNDSGNSYQGDSSDDDNLKAVVSSNTGSTATAGYVFLSAGGGTRFFQEEVLVYSDELPDYPFTEISSYAFSLRNSDIADGVKAALKIDGTWYVSSDTYSATTWTDFDIDPYVDTTWRPLTVNPGVVELSEGSTTSLPTSGTLEEVGLYVSETIPLTSWIRMDTVSVTVDSGANLSEPAIISVTASGNDGNVPANTLDDDFGTRWSSLGSGEWILYQLNDTYLLTEIDIAFFVGDTRQSDFDIEASTNGTNWTTVFSGMSGGSTTGYETFVLEPVQASYIRYVGYGNTDNLWNSITEFAIMAVEEGDTQAPTVPSGLAASNVSDSSVMLNWNASTDNVAVTGYKVYTNGSSPQSVAGTSTTISGLSASTSYTFTVSALDAAQNESSQSSGLNVSTMAVPSIIGVTASGNDGNVPANTIDDDLGTRWSSLGQGEWIKYELNGTFVVSEMDLAFYVGDTRQAYFDIQVSTDNSNWTTVYSGNSSGTTTALENFTFVPHLAKYVRYVGYGNSNNDWVSLTEVEITSLTGPDTTAPSAPSNLAADAVSESEIDLTWTASTDNLGVAGYDIYRNSSFLATTTSTSYQDTNLSANTTYSYYVFAFDGSDNVSSASNTDSATTLSSSGGELTWSPPSLQNPITKYVSTSGGTVSMTAGQDYYVVMPASVVTAGVVLNGGRNVILIGGEISIPYQGVDPTINQRRALYIANQTGTVHIEGLLMHGDDISEGIQINARDATVQIQNCAVYNMHARDQVGFTDNHPDCIQTWGSVGELRVDMFTGQTDYQGLLLKSDVQHSHGDVYLKRTNIFGDETARYQFWMSDGRYSTGYPTVDLEDVYIDVPPERSGGLGKSVWPDKDDGTYPASITTDEDGTHATWSSLPVTGRVTEGLPPGGNYVPASSIGIGYTTPGYQ